MDRHLMGKKDGQEFGTRTTPVSPKPDGKKKKSRKSSEQSKCVKQADGSPFSVITCRA